MFFVPIAGDNTEFTIEGVAGGNSVWLTNSNGSLTNYNTVPFTLKPFTGLNASIYYDGYLLLGQENIISEDNALATFITTRTAAIAASVVFGQMGGSEDSAYAVSQGFSLSTKREIGTIVIRCCRGTSGGVDDSGNSAPEDPNRILVVDIYEDDNGAPGLSVLASVSVPAASLRPFDDFEEVPKDSDMADLSVSFFDVRLEEGAYHIVLREDGDDDAGGRFWILTDINSKFPVGPASWNNTRPIDSRNWRVLTGQIQLTINLRDNPTG